MNELNYNSRHILEQVRDKKFDPNYDLKNYKRCCEILNDNLELYDLVFDEKKEKLLKFSIEKLVELNDALVKE